MSEPKPPIHLSGEAFSSIEEAMTALRMPPTAYTFDEGQRQAILLAIGHLAVDRPGWDFMLGEIADVFEGREMYDRFKAMEQAERDPQLKSPARGGAQV
jgi:hypothetical protein